jgi:hypothetical protein
MKTRIADRRLHERVPLRVELWEETHRGRSRARASNISELGMSYSGSAFAPRIDGEEVILRFRLPGDGRPIEVLGAVADERCLARTSQTCVTFVWPRLDDVERIRSYVDFVSR